MSLVLDATDLAIPFHHHSILRRHLPSPLSSLKRMHPSVWMVTRSHHLETFYEMASVSPRQASLVLVLDVALAVY